MFDDLEELDRTARGDPSFAGPPRRSQVIAPSPRRPYRTLCAKAVRKRSSYRDPPFLENPEL